ncbi:MAG TPA: CHAT domain-containing protein, partial [Thermoanaerobaculia bacterium]|nr:CHAT domain-containing protein [Thermoanaerobaculia bacterium]
GVGGRVRARAEGERLPADTVASDKLYIIDRSSGGEPRLEFLFDSPTLSENLRLESDPIRGDRSSWIGGLYRDIEGFWAAHEHDFDGFMSDLRAFGATLFEELVPERLQELLWKHRDRLQAIQVLSSEPFVPWEVLHLKEPGSRLPREGHHFFAELGLVRWLMNKTGPPRHLPRPGKAVYVVPDYPVPEHRLPGAQEEKRLLEEIWRARALHPATAEDVKDLLARPGDLSLLHFACHGEAASQEIRNAHLMMAGRIEPDGEYRQDVLNATAVEQYAALSGDGRRPLVFLNACQIGRSGYQLTGLGGFAEAFLQAGAGAFIGTLWSVGDQPALHFADGFYRSLAAGDTIVEATRAGRREAREAHDVTWLAYVVYADPYARMV